MKRMILFLLTVCFCSVLASKADAQQRKRQRTPPTKASQPRRAADQPAASQQQKQQTPAPKDEPYYFRRKTNSTGPAQTNTQVLQLKTGQLVEGEIKGLIVQKAEIIKVSAAAYRLTTGQDIFQIDEEGVHVHGVSTIMIAANDDESKPISDLTLIEEAAQNRQLRLGKIMKDEVSTTIAVKSVKYTKGVKTEEGALQERMLILGELRCDGACRITPSLEIITANGVVTIPVNKIVKLNMFGQKTETSLPSSGGLLPGEVRINPKDGLPYVWVPSGRFDMGCSSDDERCNEDEKPRHSVEITTGFWMGQTEVTQEAYERLSPVNLSSWKRPRLPVDMVNWVAARDFCEKAGMRLPTEAEWEYAARAGTTGMRYDRLDKIAQFGDGMQDVGGKDPNLWNIYDMLGNVEEWVADWYQSQYYSSGQTRDPKGPSSGIDIACRTAKDTPCEFRTLRGGGWYTPPGGLRMSFRRGSLPEDNTYAFVGFRCVGELPDKGR